MKTRLLGVLLAITITILTCLAPAAALAAAGETTGEGTNPFLKGGITGSCGNTGVGPAGILVLFAAWAVRRGKASK